MSLKFKRPTCKVKADSDSVNHWSGAIVVTCPRVLPNPFSSSSVLGIKN